MPAAWRRSCARAGIARWWPRAWTAIWSGPEDRHCKVHNGPSLITRPPARRAITCTLTLGRCLLAYLTSFDELVLCHPCSDVLRADLLLRGMAGGGGSEAVPGDVDG